MRVLCVDNGAFVARGQERLMNRHTARFFLELAQLHPGLGLAQGVVEWGDKDTLADFDLAADPRVTLHSLPWSEATWARLVYYARSIPWAFSLVARSDHLYIFFPGNLSLVFAFAARVLRRPYGVYLRGALRIDNPTTAWALRGARFVLATGDSLRDVARGLGANADTVVPMLEITASDVVEPAAARTEPPWRLLFVGRIEEAKGVPELVEAVRILTGRGVAVELDVVGGGPELESYREQLGETPNIRLPGVVSDPEELAGFFRRADLFVFPSHLEGFPRVLYEAMTYGTPVATTFVGGIPSVMVEGENCVRLEVKNASGLADTVESVLDSAATRQRLATGGVATMRRLLSAWGQSHAEQVAERIRRSSSSGVALGS